jgi:hypothetical protein
LRRGKVGSGHYDKAKELVIWKIYGSAGVEYALVFGRKVVEKMWRQCHGCQNLMILTSGPGDLGWCRKRVETLKEAGRVDGHVLHLILQLQKMTLLRANARHC